VTRGEGSATVLRFVRPTKAERRRLAVLPDELNHARPRTRGDCTVCPECQAWRDNGTSPACGHDEEEAIRRSRPCIYVGCRYGLYLDVTFAGSIRFTFSDLEPDELHPSCTLDISEAELPLERIGELLNMTKERARQVEVDAMRKAETKLREIHG
jgi:hypothetical protein